VRQGGGKSARWRAVLYVAGVVVVVVLIFARLGSLCRLSPFPTTQRPPTKTLSNRSSVKEAQDLATQLLGAGLLVGADAGRGGEHDRPEQPGRQQALHPVLDVAVADVVARGDDAALVEAEMKGRRESGAGRERAREGGGGRGRSEWGGARPSLPSFYSPSVELDHDLARPVVVHELELADVALGVEEERRGEERQGVSVKREESGGGRVPIAAAFAPNGPREPPQPQRPPRVRCRQSLDVWRGWKGGGEGRWRREGGAGQLPASRSESALPSPSACGSWRAGRAPCPRALAP